MSKKVVKSLVCENCTSYFGAKTGRLNSGFCLRGGQVMYRNNPFCSKFNPNWVLTVVTTPEYARQYSDKLSADCII